MKAIIVLSAILLISCTTNDQYRLPMPNGYIYTETSVNQNSSPNIYQGFMDNGCTVGGEIPDGGSEKIYYFECDIRGGF